MKLAVYATCRNQAPYVPRWVSSMAKADDLYVLDLGSTDGSRELLQAAGCRVTESHTNLRDGNAARNEALALLPEDTDICVFTRLDEVFLPGWGDLLRQCWLPWTQQVYFQGLQTIRGGRPLLCQLGCIHARHDFLWQAADMAAPVYTGPYNPVIVYIPELQLLSLPIPGSCL